MSDIKCAVCSEPFDEYGVNHGDMLQWQSVLFKQGAGCPSCEGVKPDWMSDKQELEILRDRLLFDTSEDGDLELLDRLLTDGTNTNRPTWKAPEPKVLWTCAGCGVSVVEDVEAHWSGDKEVPLAWYGGQKVHYCEGVGDPYGDSIHPEDPTVKPSYEIDDKPYCPGCCQSCSSCGIEIFSRSELEFGDPSASGSSFMPPGKFMSEDAVCYDCYSELCPTCGASPTEECICGETDENV